MVRAFFACAASLTPPFPAYSHSARLDFCSHSHIMQRLLPLTLATLAGSAVLLTHTHADTAYTEFDASASPPSFLSTLSTSSFHSLSIVRTYEHSPQHFTQGFTIDNTESDARTEGIMDFYEGTGVWGGTYLHHYTMPIDYPNAELKLRSSLKMPQNVFGEGICVLPNTVLQLTWQNSHWLQYPKSLFTEGAAASSSQDSVTPAIAKSSQYRTLAYPTSSASMLADSRVVPGWKEGWGAAYDHARAEIYVTDGSNHVFILDETDLTRVKKRLNVHYIDTRGHEVEVDNLNELEYIPAAAGSNQEGELFANYYESYCILRIQPSTGLILGVLKADGRTFYKPPSAQRRHPSVEAMNGIAFHEKSQRLFVTGKLWKAVYEVQAKPHADAPESASGYDSWHLDLSRYCPRLTMGAADMSYWQTVIASQAKSGAEVEGVADAPGVSTMRFQQQHAEQEQQERQWTAAPPQSTAHKELTKQHQQQLDELAITAAAQKRQARLDALADREGDLSSEARSELERSEESAVVLGHNDRHFDVASYVALEMRTMSREAQEERKASAEVFPELMTEADAMMSGDMD